MYLSQEEIEKIIANEIEVDCYTEEEAIMGWYYYLADGLNFPFKAKYLQKKRNGENEWIEVEVIGKYSDEDEFNGEEFYVEIELHDMLIPARLSELRNLKISEEEEKVIEVWNYRINGRQL